LDESAPESGQFHAEGDAQRAEQYPVQEELDQRRCVRGSGTFASHERNDGS
jgi:hypothetical protein